MTRETSISMDHASRMDHKCTRSAGLNMNPDRRAHRSGPRRGPDHIPHDRGPGRGTADRARRQNAQHSQCAHRTRGYPRGRGATQPDMCNTTRPSLARDRQEQHSTHDLTLATSPPEDKHRGAHTSPRRQPTPSDVHVSQYMLPHTCRPMSMHHVLRPMCHVHAHVLFRAPALHILCAPLLRRMAATSSEASPARTGSLAEALRLRLGLRHGAIDRRLGALKLCAHRLRHLVHNLLGFGKRRRRRRLELLAVVPRRVVHAAGRLGPGQGELCAGEKGWRRAGRGERLGRKSGVCGITEGGGIAVVMSSRGLRMVVCSRSGGVVGESGARSTGGRDLLRCASSAKSSSAARA